MLSQMLLRQSWKEISMHSSMHSSKLNIYDFKLILIIIHSLVLQTNLTYNLMNIFKLSINKSIGILKIMYHEWASDIDVRWSSS